MCVIQGMVPEAIEAVKAVAQIAYSIYNVYQTTETIRVNRLQAEENANVARQNAEIARQKAVEERQNSIEEAREKRFQTLRRMAEMKTTVAAGNIDVDSGTSLDKLDSLSNEGELDALSILDKGEKSAQKYLLAADSYDKKGNLIIEKQKNDMKVAALGYLGKGLKSVSDKSKELVIS